MCVEIWKKLSILWYTKFQLITVKYHEVKALFCKISCHVEKLGSVHTKCQYQVTVLGTDQSGRSKYKTGVVSFLLCMTYHAEITLTYFCIYNEFVTPILKTVVFLSRYPIYRLKPLMNNLRTLATHIDRRKWKIKIFCGRKIFMKSGPSFQHFHKKSHQKCHAILPHS